MAAIEATRLLTIALAEVSPHGVARTNVEFFFRLDRMCRSP